MDRVSQWIGGAEVPTDSDRAGQIFNPATGIQTGVVGFGLTHDVDRAVDAAAKAFGEWRETPLPVRTQVLLSLHSILRLQQRELAAAISREHGKVLDDALAEIHRTLETIEFAISVPTFLKGGFSEQVSRGVDAYSVRQPLGVVAAITPFNFPVLIPMWMSAIAITCGNSVVLKPSERDPSASMIVAKAWQEAGLPDGVFNVVHGDAVVVNRLIEHPEVKAVSFVGSTATAEYVYRTATAHHKRVQAFGGAKNHMVVLPDADLALTADAAVSAAFGAAGERCMAISTIVAVAPVADDLIDEIVRRIPDVRIGPGMAATSDVGPLIDPAAKERVSSYLEIAEQEGAKIVVDGRHAEVPADGYFVGCSLIDHVSPGSRVHMDEIFGPVLAVVRVESFDAALRIVNDHPYGNGAALFTGDGAAARRFQFECQAGQLGINVPIPVPISYFSFGGWKKSAFGDIDINGPDGVSFYTHTKTITTRWPSSNASTLDFALPKNN